MRTEIADAGWLLRYLDVNTGALLWVTIVDNDGLPSCAIVCTVGLLLDVFDGIKNLLRGMNVGIGGGLTTDSKAVEGTSTLEV